MFWAGLLQVGEALVSISCCPVFRRSARAGLLALERGLHTPSISCPCKTSAGVLSTLERVSCARAGLLALERVVPFSVKFWEMKICARADWLFTLERMCFAFVSWRSSGHLCARAGADVCALRSSALFYARAGHAYMSYPLGDFKSLFTFLSLSYFSKIDFESLFL